MICGIDFGTSNSAVCLEGTGGGDVEMVRLEGGSTNIPSAIFFDTDENKVAFGQAGIDAFTAGQEGRLMRSLKSILGTELIHEKTQIGARHVSFEDILSTFISHLKTTAQTQRGAELSSVVMGRPVYFVDGNQSADTKAQNKLEEVARKAGFILLVFAGLIGLPHGLTDFSLLKRAGGSFNKKVPDHYRFGVGFLVYLAIMGVFFGVWQVAPLWALVAFLFIAGFHFARQDSRAYSLTGWRRGLFAASRGLMVIALPFFLHSQTSEVFNAMIGAEVFCKPALNTPALMVLGLFFLLPAFLTKNRNIIAEQLLLILVYLALPPLVSFTLYFCLWHTPRHYIEEMDVIRKHVLAKITKFRLAFIFVLSGVIYMSLLFYLAPLWHSAAAYFFILVSCLTVAHVAFSEGFRSPATYDHH